MQIVIDIAQNEYDALEKLDATYLLHIIKDGTPLPKGHGALKDVDAIIAEHAMTKFDWRDCIDIEDLKNAPTIIEADKEGNNGDSN